MKKKPNNYKITPEKVYELICEEREHNPIVGTAFYETKQFLMGLGYSKGGATIVLQRIERIYDLNLCRRGQDHRRTDNGEVVNREFGVTRQSNIRLYQTILNFYRKRLSCGKSKEQAIKEAHEYYDPILAKELGCETQTGQNTITIPKSLSASGRCKDLSDLEIEI